MKARNSGVPGCSYSGGAFLFRVLRKLQFQRQNQGQLSVRDKQKISFICSLNCPHFFCLGNSDEPDKMKNKTNDLILARPMVFKVESHLRQMYTGDLPKSAEALDDEKFKSYANRVKMYKQLMKDRKYGQKVQEFWDLLVNVRTEGA